MTQAARDELRADLLSRIPRWYSPWAHLLGPTVVGLALVALVLSRIHALRGWELALVPVFGVVANAVEWHAHRDLLHRRTFPIEVLYVRHVPQHHAIYVPEDMSIRDWRELKLVLLPAYGVLAVVAVSSPVAIALLLVRQPNVAALWIATAALYVLSYEWLHLSYHLPRDHPVTRLPAIRWLRRHHERHHAPHLMQRWNFNVTLPLWDHLRRTVYRPSDAPRRAIPGHA